MTLYPQQIWMHGESKLGYFRAISRIEEGVVFFDSSTKMFQSTPIGQFKKWIISRKCFLHG